MPRKRKKKELTWHAILSKRKEILLAMAVAGVTREDGIVKYRQTFKANGGSNNPYKASCSVADILTWDHFDMLPECWPRLIAEYAKPFVDGLTKKIAPKLYREYIQEYAKRRHDKIQRNFRMEAMEMERHKHQEDVPKVHYRGGILYDYSKKPVNQPSTFYIEYLRHKLTNNNFAQKFVDKYVLVPGKDKTLDLVRGRIYYLRDSTEVGKYQDIIKKYHVTMFETVYSMHTLLPIRPLRLDSYNFEHMVKDKCARKKIRNFDEFRLVKHRNRLYIVLM